MAGTRTATAPVLDEPESRIEASPNTLMDFISCNNAGQLFDACDEETRRMLFLEMLQDYRLFRRRPAADQTLARSSNVPTYDPRYSGDSTGLGEYDMGEVCVEPGKISPIRLVVNKNSTGIDIFADGYMVKGHFWKQWTFSLDEDDPEPKSKAKTRATQTSKWVQWTDGNLYTTSKTSGYKCWDIPKHPRPESTEECWLPSLISSPLLVYRLMVVFGMPPPSDQLDPHKQIWGATLYWREDGKSSLTFEDWKGWTQVSFQGCEEASKSALKLFEWLLSTNVPHPYDYTLAGRAA